MCITCVAHDLSVMYVLTELYMSVGSATDGGSVLPLLLSSSPWLPPGGREVVPGAVQPAG